MVHAAVSFEGDRLRIPSDAFDHAGFRRWVMSEDFPSDTRATFVLGEMFIEMSPESTESHNKVKGEVTRALLQLLKEDDRGEGYADGTLLSNEAAGLSTEPDFTFVSWDAFRTARVRLVEKADRADEFIELVGTPDLVVEVVSDSSVRKDLVRLRDAYARAGIPEYWIIDARGLDVKLEILAHGDDGYRPSTARDGRAESRVFGRSVELARRKNPVGRWSYHLTLEP